jgi:glutathione S-transferase
MACAGMLKLGPGLPTTPHRPGRLPIAVARSRTLMNHTLHYTLGSGNSFKPALVLRQTGRHCRMRRVDVLGGETRGPEFLAINPRGQVPYLVLADGRGIGESNAIAWLLAEGSALMPTDPVARAQAVQWMIFEQTALEPCISPARFFTHIVPAQREAHAADIVRWQEGAHRGLKLLDAHLAGREFITDHGYSVADIAVYGYVHLAPQGGIELEPYGAVGRWMQRVAQSKDYAPLDELLRA